MNSNFFSLSGRPRDSLRTKKQYIDPKTESPEKMKNTMLGPSFVGDIAIGQMRERIKTVPHRVSRHIPKAASIVVSAAYNQATGPLDY